VTQTVETLLQWGLTQLSPIIKDGSATDVRVLLAYALGIDRGLLGARLQNAATPEQVIRFKAAIAQRVQHQPVAQIIGVREFWGRNFAVTPDVLDPRPDTETLIEEVLKNGTATNILDLGTGSGCILLTLLSEWPDAHGVGVDQSEKALLVAQDNCRSLGLTKRATLKQSDWFSDVTGKFDLIVSNPPYITADAMLTIAPDVRDWEPRIALTPEGDGLDAYREIARKAGQYLTTNGRIFVEIGWDQAQSVLDIFAEMGFSDGLCIQDLAGKDRVIAFLW